MPWNYRLILHDTDANPERHWIGLHEVYYDDLSRPDYWTEDAVTFRCHADEGPQGLIESLEMALDDARKYPMLRESELRADIAARPKRAEALSRLAEADAELL